MPGYRMLMRVAVLKMQWAMMGVQMLPVYSYSSTSTAPKIARGDERNQADVDDAEEEGGGDQGKPDARVFFFMIGYR